MSKKKLEEAAKNNGYSGRNAVHEMKDDLGLNRKSDIFVDKKGNMYSGGTKGHNRVLDSLNMNVKGH